jgi:hypothetical protein
MELLKKYFEIQKQIHDYFGYQEDWVCIPLEDLTDKHWFITGESYEYKCVYSDEPLTLESIKEGKTIYSASIYTQRFLPKWVYKAEDFTMVCADTHTDGNKFLMVFSNKLQVVDEKLFQEYLKCWGGF